MRGVTRGQPQILHVTIPSESYPKKPALGANSSCVQFVNKATMLNLYRHFWNFFGRLLAKVTVSSCHNSQQARGQISTVGDSYNCFHLQCGSRGQQQTSSWSRGRPLKFMPDGQAGRRARTRNPNSLIISCVK